MASVNLEMALREMSPESLLAEISEVQNSIAHLRRSNRDMREFDPDNKDPTLVEAQRENEDVIQRNEDRIDLALRIIREKLGDTAGDRMEEIVRTFRQQYETQDEESKEGVYL